jgi:hypothetical protein
MRKAHKGTYQKNTKRVPHKRSTLGRPGKREKPVKNEPELPGPIVIDVRRHKKERLAPVHFLKCSRNRAHIKRKLSWWYLVIATDTSKSRLSRRWTYICTHEARRGPGDTGGLLVGRDPRKTTLGRHFKMNVNSFYVTTNGSSMTDWERASSKTPIRVIPRLRGGTGPKGRSTRSPALDFRTELAEVRRRLHQNMSLHSLPDLGVKTLTDGFIPQIIFFLKPSPPTVWIKR